jgi:hypothetical protein
MPLSRMLLGHHQMRLALEPAQHKKFTRLPRSATTRSM